VVLHQREGILLQWLEEEEVGNCPQPNALFDQGLPVIGDFADIEGYGTRFSLLSITSAHHGTYLQNRCRR
jgi:hypothetical protein